MAAAAPGAGAGAPAPRALAWGALLSSATCARARGLTALAFVSSLRARWASLGPLLGAGRGAELLPALRFVSARWADLGLPPPPPPPPAPARAGADAHPSARALTFGTTFRACAVCLEEYAVGDDLLVLELCGHCFHRACLDAWVRAAHRPVCPVCAAPAPAPAPDAPAAAHPPGEPRPAGGRADAAAHAPPVQLIDLSVHGSWADWLAQLLKGEVPQERPPLSLMLPAD